MMREGGLSAWNGPRTRGLSPCGSMEVGYSRGLIFLPFCMAFGVGLAVTTAGSWNL